MPSTTTITTTTATVDNQSITQDPLANVDPISNEKIAALLAQTGYSLVQENGQRKYGGPPPDYTGKTPLRGCEVFVGKLPRDLLEDELVPVFERVGKLWEIRLMMDFNGQNRGFAFVTYTCREDAKRAVRELDNFEIRRNKHIGVVPSVDNCRIFIGGIPRNRTRAEVKVEVAKLTEGVVDVILYQSAGDKSKNRGFAFVEYDSHKAAAMARRKLAPGKIQLWGNAIAVDWAEPEQDVDEETMANVKILYVRNLMLSTPEDKLREFIEKLCPNAVERVKKLRDYAFVHFYKREDALSAMEMLDGNELDGAELEVVLAKPPDKSLMRYVKSVQKIGSIMAGGVGGGIHANIVNAATSLYHQASGNLSLSPQPLSPESGIFSPGFRSPSWVDPFVGGFMTNPNDKAQMQRNQMNNRRVRGAAGMRGAGARQEVANMVRSVLNPQIGKRLNDCQLLDLPANMAPMTTAFKPPKSCCQFLDDICKQHGLGEPQYEVQSATVKDDLGNEVVQYLGKVSIPTLFQLGSVGSGRLAPSTDVAKEHAAQVILWKLGFQLTPGYDEPYMCHCCLPQLICDSTDPCHSPESRTSPITVISDHSSDFSSGSSIDFSQTLQTIPIIPIQLPHQYQIELPQQYQIVSLQPQNVSGLFPPPMTVFPAPPQFYGPATTPIFPSMFYPATYFSTGPNGPAYWPQQLIAQPPMNPGGPQMLSNKAGDIQQPAVPGIGYPMSGATAIPSNGYPIPTSPTNGEFILPPAYSQQ